MLLFTLKMPGEGRARVLYFLHPSSSSTAASAGTRLERGNNEVRRPLSPATGLVLVAPALLLPRTAWAGVSEPYAASSVALLLAGLTVAVLLGALLVQARRLRACKRKVVAVGERLAAHERDLQTILSTTSDHLFFFDAQARYRYVSRAGARALGQEVDALIGRSWDELNLPEGMSEPFEHQLRQVLASGESVTGEAAYTTLQGRHYFEHIINPVRDERNAIVGAVLSARNVTERRRARRMLLRLNRQLDARVEARTAELQAANKELEGFAYSVSHDLRAPLRALVGFSRILLADYSDELPPRARDYLGRIRDNAGRMGELIDDLLRFSRLSRQDMVMQQVDPRTLVQDALDELAFMREDRLVNVTVDDLPSVVADAGLLRQVYVNLLSNALKFTRRCAVAEIHVGAFEQEGRYVFFVRDNGVGFEMQYAHKLFGVFQRLHRFEDFEGTGVGLAVVQRVVHRHGGEVWVEAGLDRGATFFFTLPRQDHHAR